ncbi:DUF3991 and TOPRIM domain-containing protein [Clostridium ljungdahlii]|uniref:DUF3991 domain-containing protein n=1 Tax=Clostridium ljungdahlii TaxID=1538 RepID=A0A168PIL4_9CLOT|nr:DUF3991 and TOPRIM domain-containing protein [Clostridium ljungdahlii]OAA87789.1 hypothetical protein WY13_01904 [Clostridium ljungdahlii]
MPLLEDEIINKAKSVDLKSFLESQGFNFIEESTNNYRSKEEHTLVVTYKYETPIYFWYKYGQQGNIINYVMSNITSNDFRKAVKYLLKDSINSTRQTLCYKKNSAETKRASIDIKYSTNEIKHVYGYLCKTRGINAKVINEFISKGLLGEDERHNALFLHLNEMNKVVGADKCGTNSYINTRFKGVVSGSNQNYGFAYKIGTKFKNLMVFEAPIDLISYFQINQSILHNCLLLSTGGSAKINIIQTYISIYESIDTICVCTDNDDSGHKAYMNIKNQYRNCNVMDGRQELRSKGVKDFNELLMKR